MKSLLSYVHKIICGFLCCISAFGGVSLGRVTGLDGGSLSFNASHRRIIEPSDVEVPSTPLDLFYAGNFRRKNQIDSIWKWDFWCQLQPKVGNCSNVVNAFYYDAQLDQCRSFTHSGCDGNENNFATIVECERHCKGSTYMALKETTRSISYCALQPNTGLCLALSERFYYDVNAGHCKKFVYGGCGGNQNRFLAKQACDDRCVDNGTR